MFVPPESDLKYNGQSVHMIHALGGTPPLTLLQRRHWPWYPHAAHAARAPYDLHSTCIDAALISAHVRVQCHTRELQNSTTSCTMVPHKHVHGAVTRSSCHRDCTVPSGRWLKQTVLRVEIYVRSRVAAIRLAVHLLGGGAGDDLPANWQAVDFLGPPGPAAEYAHCSHGLRQASAPDAGSTEARWMDFHTAIALHHNFGLTSTGAAGGSLKVSEWTVQALAAAPCLGIMLQMSQKTLSIVVRRRHRPPPPRA